MTQSEKIDSILKDVQGTKIDVMYIKSILDDNPNTGQIGIARLAINNKERLDKNDTDKKVLIGKASTASAILTGGLLWLLKVLGLIF